jgi:hypothetical protein
MKYIRFISKDTNTYFSDILSKACTIYTHNKLLKEKNAFLLKGDFVYVNTIYGDLGVNFDYNMTSVITGERVSLTHYIPNLHTIRCENGDYKFKVGRRYVKVTKGGTIDLTLFKKLGTQFRGCHVHVVECESCDWFINFFTFKWLRDLLIKL